MSQQPDLGAGDWVRVAQEWRRLDGTRPESRIEGRCAYYGCDTGCTGYVLYHVRPGGDEEDQVGGFHFGRDDAVKAAEEYGKEYGLPVVMERDWD